MTCLQQFSFQGRLKADFYAIPTKTQQLIQHLLITNRYLYTVLKVFLIPWRHCE